LAPTIALQRLQSIARQGRQIGQAPRGLKPVEAQLGLTREPGERRDPPSGREALGPPVPETDNHDPS